MPVASVPIREARIPFRLLQQYLFLLKTYPILTKSVTSGILSSLGNLLSQFLEANKSAKNGKPVKEINRAAATRYAIFGLFLTGPLSHYFYQLMEVWMPTTDPYYIVKRLLLDRLIFAPVFLFIFYLVMNTLEFSCSSSKEMNRKTGDEQENGVYLHPESKGLADLQNKLEDTYWTALKMNWRVWTPFQFININFVPVQFRVLFANGVALFWYAYLASVRK